MNIIFRRPIILLIYTCISALFLGNHLLSASETSDFTKLVAEYEAREEKINTEIQPQMDKAKDDYIATLETLMSKLSESKKAAYQVELHRFSLRGQRSNPHTLVPIEIRTAWKKYVNTVDKINKSVERNRKNIRSDFVKSFSQLEKVYQRKNDAEGMALTRRARTAMFLLDKIESNQITPGGTLGSNNYQWHWNDIVKEGGYIVGFEAAEGKWNQSSVLGSLTPIYATAGGLRNGEKRGNGNDNVKRVIAKDGYAVGGLIVRGGDVVHSIQIIFMQIKQDGVSLNMADSYLSEKLGGDGGGDPKKVLNGGKMIVGLTGASGDVVDSIGFIYPK